VNVIDVATLSAVTVALTEILKRGLKRPSWGLGIAVFSTFVVMIAFLASQPDMPARTDIWSIVLAFITILGTATGFYQLSTATHRQAIQARDLMAAKQQHWDPATDDPREPRPRIRLRPAAPNPPLGVTTGVRS